MFDFLKRAFPLQRGDLPRGLLLVAYLFLIVCAYQIGRVARDALFLDRFKAELLPYADISVFVMVAVTVAAYIRIGTRTGLRPVLQGSLLLFGATGFVFAALARGSTPVWLYPVVYVWVGIFGVMAPAQVWTLANYVVAPREAKRLFGLVAAGASLGATVGGLLSSVLARSYGAESLLAVMAGLILVATFVVGQLWRRRPEALTALEAPAAKEPEAKKRASMGNLHQSLRVVSRSPYLRAVAGVIALSSWITAIAGWQYKAIAQQVFVLKGAEHAADALAGFFGTVEASMGAACLVVQLLLTARILRNMGLRSVLFLLPLGLLAGSTGLLVFGTLAAAVALRATDKIVRYSIDRPAVELLYFPVPLSLKLPAKSFIDTVVWRAGDGLQGLTVLAFVTLGLPPAQLSWVTLPLIGVWLVVAAAAYRRYVGTLEESVTQHRLDLERAGTPVLDRATTDILAARLEGVNPKEILYALDLMAGNPHQAAHPGVQGLLDHSAPEVRRRALEILGDAGDRTVIERVESLLADPSMDVRTEALLYLARHADVDPLTRVQDLGNFTDASIRATIIAVLARLGEERQDAARLMFETMVAEEGSEGLETRREAARLAERLPVVFEEPLRQLLQDEDTDVARSAIRAARRHGAGPFADLLLARMGDGMLRDEARLALTDIGTEVLETVTRVLDDPHVSAEIRQAVPELLERIGGDEAAGILSGRLMEGDAELRLRVLRVLAKMREQRPTLEIDGWALEAVLGAEILGHYRSYQILGALERSALKEQPTTRGLRIAMLEELERIFFLLGLLYPGTDFRAAWEALRSGNPVLRDQALDLLESRLKPEMRTLLVPLIDPEIPGDQRMELAEKLAGTPVTTPAEAVRALAATGDPWLKSCAAYAIGAHGLHELKDLLDEWEKDADPLLRETVRQAQAQFRE